MKVKELLETTHWTLLTPTTTLDQDIKGVYCSDLLSWVMGKGQPQQAWITIQAHINIIAIAELREFACVIMAENVGVNHEMIAKANEENVTLIASGLPIYETSCQLMKLGL